MSLADAEALIGADVFEFLGSIPSPARPPDNANEALGRSNRFDHFDATEFLARDAADT
jgi:hypothetical protein